MHLVMWSPIPLLALLDLMWSAIQQLAMLNFMRFKSGHQNNDLIPMISGDFWLTYGDPHHK